jgi:hypothetical protein
MLKISIFAFIFLLNTFIHAQSNTTTPIPSTTTTTTIPPTTFPPTTSFQRITPNFNIKERRKDPFIISAILLSRLSNSNKPEVTKLTDTTDIIDYYKPYRLV